MAPIGAATFQPGIVPAVLFAGAPQRPMTFPAGRGLLVNVAGAMMGALNATGGRRQSRNGVRRGNSWSAARHGTWHLASPLAYQGFGALPVGGGTHSGTSSMVAGDGNAVGVPGAAPSPEW